MGVSRPTRKAGILKQGQSTRKATRTRTLGTTGGMPRPDKWGIAARRRKPREIAVGTFASTRGVIARVRVKGGLPTVLRLSGRKGRNRSCDVRLAKIVGLQVVPPREPLFGSHRRRAEDNRAAHGLHDGPPGNASERIVETNDIHSENKTHPAYRDPHDAGSAHAVKAGVPLPQKDEPLVENAAPQVRDPALQPLARDRSLAPVRGGLIAHMEAWLRDTAQKMGRLMGPRPDASKAAAPRPQPTAPAITRANREIRALRAENEKLRQRLQALESVPWTSEPAR